MRAARRARALVVPGAALLLLLTGACRAPYETRVESARRAWARGDVGESVRLLTALRERARGGPDEGVLSLELASALSAAGRHAEAARELVAADRRLEELDASTAPLELIAATLFGSEPSAYRAARHEKLLVNTLNMLEFLAAGEIESAAVEARRARILMLQADLPEELRYANPLAWNLAGLCLQLAGRENEARDAFREGGDRLAARPSAGQGSLLVVAGLGLAPVRVQGQARLVLAGKLYRVQYPALVERRPAVGPTTLRVDGEAAGELPVLLEFGAQARHRYGCELPRLLAAAVLASLPRAEAGQRLHEELRDDEQPDEASRNVFALLAGLLFSEGLAELLPADTRCWSLLPDAWAARRLALPAGRHEVELRFASGGARSFDVLVPEGGLALLRVDEALGAGWIEGRPPAPLDLAADPAGAPARALLAELRAGSGGP